MKTRKFPKLVSVGVYRCSVHRIFQHGFLAVPKTSYLERESDMKNLVRNIVSAGLVMGTAAFGSGYKCTGTAVDGTELAVKFFNHTTVNTRVPSVLLVSSEELGTVLRRTDEEIKKINRVNSVQYVVEGNRKLDADTVIFQVSHNEGRTTLEEGELVPGQLILVKEDTKEVIELSCARYLKD